MAKVLQHRRDTTTNLSSVSGAIGEFFMDTTKNTLVVMDGSTNGGHPLALESDLVSNLGDLSNVTLTTPSNGQVLKYNGSIWVNSSDAGIGLSDLSVTTNAAGSAALSYNNSTGAFSYTPPDLSSYQTTSGLNSAIDSHLNKVNFNSGYVGYVLSWNGSDYAWVAQASGADGNTQYTMQADTTAGGANLTLVGNDASTDSVKLAAGSNVTITRSDANTITIASTASGGGGDLSAVAEDILPEFDGIYDLGSTTNQWYDLFVSNSVTIGGGSLTGNEAGLVTDTILVGELLTTLNTITPDASTALQYAGDQGVVEIVGNLDVSAGDWMFTPIVESVTTTGEESDGDIFQFVGELRYWDGTGAIGGAPMDADSNYHYFDFDNNTRANQFLALLNQTDIDSFSTAVETGMGNEPGPTFTFNGTDVDAQIWEEAFSVVQWKKTSGEFSNFAMNEDGVYVAQMDPLVTFTSIIIPTTSTPPLTTGQEGMVRYNKDESALQVYTDSWGLIHTDKYEVLIDTAPSGNPSTIQNQELLLNKNYAILIENNSQISSVNIPDGTTVGDQIRISYKILPGGTNPLSITLFWKRDFGVPSTTTGSIMNDVTVQFVWTGVYWTEIEGNFEVGP